MKEFLDFFISKILPENSEYNIARHEDESGITFEIQVPEEFRGKLIGRGGQNIKSLRDVVSIIARRENQRVFLKVTD